MAAGLSAKQLRTLVATGVLVQIRYGAYARADVLAASTGSPAQAHALQVAAAIASKDRDHVASHFSAATVHGLDLLTRPSEGTVVLTREPDRMSGRSRRADGLIIHAARLPVEHVATECGIRVTTPARTVVDLARVLPFMDAVVVADSAIRKLKASKEQMRRVLRACRHWPGATAADRVIDFSSGLSESALETCGRVKFAEAGLPRPQLQAEFHDSEGNFIGRVDFFWPEYKTIVEADGMLKYDDPANPGAMRDQFRRDRLLRELGYKVVHFTWHELFTQAERVIARMRAAFAAPASWLCEPGGASYYWRVTTTTLDYWT
jgi:hypothetical protein